MLGQKYDYIFLSPIFNSISKQGYNSNFTHKELLVLKRISLINDKVYALGGVNKDNLVDVTSFGFGGASVLGYLWCDNINEVTSKSIILS